MPTFICELVSPSWCNDISFYNVHHTIYYYHYYYELSRSTSRLSNICSNIVVLMPSFVYWQTNDKHAHIYCTHATDGYNNVFNKNRKQIDEKKDKLSRWKYTNKFEKNRNNIINDPAESCHDIPIFSGVLKTYESLDGYIFLSTTLHLCTPSEEIHLGVCDENEWIVVFSGDRRYRLTKRNTNISVYNNNIR